MEMEEQGIPASFSLGAEGAELPLRLLTGFEVVGEGGVLQPLHALQPGSGTPRLVLTGQLVQPDGAGPSPEQLPTITTAPLVDWVVEASAAAADGQALGLWAVTPHAWYKLLEPTERYAALFAAAKEAAAAQAEARTGAAQRRAGGSKRSAAGAAGAGKPKRSKASHGAGGSKVRFAGAAVGSAAASMADLSAYAFGEAEAVSDEDMPDDFQVSDAEADLDGGNLGRARRKAWQRIKYWQRRAVEEEQQRAEAEARAAADSAADAQRGPPPQPYSTGFRVPPSCVPDLLMVWDFTQAFSDVLQLPPYSLAALEAAICPGPCLPRPALPSTPAAPAAEAAAEQADTGGASAAAGDGEEQSGSQEEEEEQQQQQPSSPVLPGSAAAGGEAQEVAPGQQAPSAAADGDEGGSAAAAAAAAPAAAAAAAVAGERSPTVEQEGQQKLQGATLSPDQDGVEPMQASPQEPPQEQQREQQHEQLQEEQPMQVNGELGQQGELSTQPAEQAEQQQQQHDAEPTTATAPGPQSGGRPRRATAGHWMRHSSEDFIVEEPALIKPRRQSKQDDAGATVPAQQAQQPLRFRVSLGGAGKGSAGRPVRRSSDAGEASTTQQHAAAAAKPAGRVEQLQQKYGLAPEAARRLVPLDRDYAPSGVLLRDICCALLRVAAGRATAAAGEQPRAAKVQSEENENPLPWPERACNAVWQSPEADLEDRSVAIKLGYGDFQDLSAEERVRMLSALVRLALASEQMQAELGSRVEALAAARQVRSRDVWGPGDEDSDGEEGGQLQAPLAQAGGMSAEATPSASAQLVPAGAREARSRAGSEAPSDSFRAIARGSEQQQRQQQQSDEGPTSRAAAVGPATAADWAAWLQSRRMGLRRPLGVDLRGRRYWCLGRQAGAFRVYVEDQDGTAWGWYEGEQIAKLRSWLEQASIAAEAPLLRALRSMPLPRTSGRNQRLLGGTELEPLRSDGYRTLVAPFLRGEWNTDKTGLLAPAEQRVLMAVDALLGVVPVWFKGPEVLQQHLAICEAIQGGNASDMARALLSAEQLLAAEGRLSEEWADVWQLPWSRAVSACGDLRDMLLYTAALQQHVRAAPDLLPRQAFLKYAIEAQCPLFFPYPGENVAVMRAGLLRHIDRYMQLLGLTPASLPAQQQGPAVSVEAEEQQGATVKVEQEAGDTGDGEAGGDAAPVKMEVDALPPLPPPEQQQQVGQQQQQQGLQQQAGAAGQVPQEIAAAFLPAGSAQTGPSQTAVGGSEAEGGSTAEEGGEAALSWKQPQPAAAPLLLGAVQLAPRVQQGKMAALQAAWDGLRQRAQALRPVERYVVRSVVYRRHLADDADLEHSEADDAARRWPVAWLVLRPAKYGPLHQLPTQDLVIPVAIDNSLPEYVVKAEAYAERMRVLWQPGDRFRMFFGGQVSRKTHKRVKTGGVWYKGTVVDVRQAQPPKDAPLEEKERYNPWESLVVQWERAVPGENETVSPWEVDVDPEEERRRVEEARRLQQAAARAQRGSARQSSRRGAGDGDGDIFDRAEQLAKQAERSLQLLSYLHPQAGADQESVFNEPVYGQPLQLQQHLLPPALPALATPVEHHHRAVASAAAAAGQVQPLHPGQEVPQEVLDMLRPLSPDAFIVMLTNFYRGLKGKFKVPTFAHRELDLFTVFWAVMERGGYETVTNGKQWKEICRCLPNVDLTGQTSASYNMRLNFERCLLDFESYLACGQYERDLAAGCAPESEFLTDPARTRFTIPGVDYSTPVPTGRGAAKPTSSQGSDLPLLGGGGRSQRPVRGSSRLKHKASGAADAGGTGSQDDLLASIAAAFPGTSALPLMLPVLPVVDAAQGAVAQQGWALPAGLGEGAAGAAGMTPLGGTWEGLLPPGSVGKLLKGLGQLSVGRMVERFWPEEGGWWAATISDYNSQTGQHQLTYNAGQEDESFEWVDFGELTNQEVRDATACAPMPGLEDLPPLPEGALPPMPLPAEGWTLPAGTAGADGATAAGAALPAGEADEATAAAAAALPVGGFMSLLADAPQQGLPGQQEKQEEPAGQQQQQQQQEQDEGAGGAQQAPQALPHGGEQQQAPQMLTVSELQAMLPQPLASEAPQQQGKQQANVEPAVPEQQQQEQQKTEEGQAEPPLDAALAPAGHGGLE